MIAREHGFASWPRLVRYMGDVERQQHGHVQLHGGTASYEHLARRLLAWHRDRNPLGARLFAAYVPRFYGRPAEMVFAATVTEDEARLATARMQGAPSWEVLLERLAAVARTHVGKWEVQPMRDARDAITAVDLQALQRAVAARPEVLHPSDNDISAGSTLMAHATRQEARRGAETMRPIIAWLEAHGLDRQVELNRMLCRAGRGGPEEVRRLLERGADPDWIAPNGLSVLEHALLVYRNAEAVDLLAAHARPQRALWIAAGLGDVEGVSEFLDRDGKPTEEARRSRPDFVAAGFPTLLPPLPDPDDEERLVEVLLVAIINGRGAVIEYLASRGAPIDSTLIGTPLVNLAVANWHVAAAEALVRSGVDLDRRGWPNGWTARELARERLENDPAHPAPRRLAEICGLDVDAILAARPTDLPVPDAFVQRALDLARVDAARMGLSAVQPENLLIGILREGGPPFYELNERFDVERFWRDMKERLEADANDVAADLPLGPEAAAVVDAAVALAGKRLRIEGMLLIQALIRPGEDGIRELLRSYGVDAEALHTKLERYHS